MSRARVETPSGLPSQRQLRVGEQMRHVIAEQFLRGEVHDAELAQINLTIAEVRVSRDLKHATVYTAELGQPTQPRTLVALERASGFLAGRLAKLMHLRYAPRLHFVGDETFETAARVQHLLDEALHRTKAGEASDEGEARGSDA